MPRAIFETVRAALLPNAEAGEVLAQYRLGLMMANAQGGPYDPDGAKLWLEKAVAQDYHPGAGAAGAGLISSGQPEVPDYERAAELLTKAIEQDQIEAHFYLAQLLRQGRGIEADPARAFDLLGKAARGGVADAQFALAQMYSRGEGTEKDDAQSSRWLLQAAEDRAARRAVVAVLQLQSRHRFFKGSRPRPGSGCPRRPGTAPLLAERIWGTHVAAGRRGRGRP